MDNGQTRDKEHCSNAVNEQAHVSGSVASCRCARATSDLMPKWPLLHAGLALRKERLHLSALIDEKPGDIPGRRFGFDYVGLLMQGALLEMNITSLVSAGRLAGGRRASASCSSSMTML